MRKTLPKFYDKEKDLVQCQLCGKWFKSLNSHIPRVHKISCEEYKKRFNLWNGDLCCQSTRIKISEYHKRPEVKEKSLKRFLEKVKPYSPENKKRGQIKERYKKMFANAGFLHTPEVKRKRKEALRKFRNDPIRFKLAMEKSAQKRRKGIWRKCEVCGKKFWVKPYMIPTARFCSRKCQNSMIGRKDYKKVLFVNGFKFEQFIKTK